MFKNISFHQSCKCGCLLDEKVCNKKQKWNKEKCRCECLVKEKCSGNYFFNVVNCTCKMKKKTAVLIEEYNIETSKKIDCFENKTVTTVNKMENCKPFVISSILFVCVSVITTGIMIYFCLKYKNSSAFPY